MSIIKIETTSEFQRIPTGITSAEMHLDTINVIRIVINGGRINRIRESFNMMIVATEGGVHLERILHMAEISAELRRVAILSTVLLVHTEKREIFRTLRDLRGRVIFQMADPTIKNTTSTVNIKLKRMRK